SDGNVQLLLQLDAEVISRRRKLLHRVGRAGLPTGQRWRPVFERHLTTDIEESNQRMTSSRSSGFSIRRLTQQALHVRLPGNQPHLTDQNILHLDRVLS